MSYTEAQQELHNDLSLMSATELRALQGDDADMDIVIADLLGAGKAVEVKGGASADADDEEEAPNAGDMTDDDDDDKDEEEDEPEVVPAPEPEPEPAAEPAPETPATDFAAPALDLSGLKDEYKETVAALKAEKTAAFQKLMDGEITPAEYSEIENKFDEGRESAREMQQAKSEWFTEVHNFRVKAAQESGVNYFADTEKFEAFDGWIKRLGENPKYDGKPAGWFLEEAHKKVLVEFDIAPKAAKTAETAAKTVADGKKVAPKTVRTPNLSGIPPTLGGLPAAASAESGDGGEFAHLDNLTGLKYEQAIARMTPEQRDRWSSM